jgi:hypothetical protein
VLLVLPFAPEWIEILVKLQDVPCVHHEPFLNYRDLDVQGQELEDAYIIAIVTKMRDELSPERGFIGCLRGYYAQVDVASRPSITSLPKEAPSFRVGRNWAPPGKYLCS